MDNTAPIVQPPGADHGGGVAIARQTIRAVAIFSLSSVLLGTPWKLIILFMLLWAFGETLLYTPWFGGNDFGTLVLVIVLLSSFVGYQCSKAWKNKVLIAQVNAIGGSVARTGGDTTIAVEYIWLGPEVGDAECERIFALEGLDNLATLIAIDCHITDRSLRGLERFGELRHVFLGSTNATPAGVDVLRRRLWKCKIVYNPDA